MVDVFGDGRVKAIFSKAFICGHVLHYRNDTSAGLGVSFPSKTTRFVLPIL